MKENSSPIRTGLCAYGMSGKVFHAPFLDCLDGFEFSAVVERHEKKAAERYPGVTSYDSVEALLGDDSIRLVVVNTPNVTHYEYARAALEAGKDVIVEKPFAATVGEAEALIALAGKQGRLLTVFQNRRWDSDFLTVKEVIGEDLLGPLVEAEFHYDRYRPEINEIKKHKEVAETGVGLIYDLGPHLIDAAIVLFGKPEAVFATLQHHRPHSVVNDYFDIKLLYEQFTCTLKSSLLVREPGPGYLLHGVLGSFIKSRGDIQEAALLIGDSPCTPAWGIEPEAEWGILHTAVDGIGVRKTYPSVQGGYQEFFKKIAGALTRNETPPVKLEDSLLNMQIIEAALKSGREREVVAL